MKFKVTITIKKKVEFDPEDYRDQLDIEEGKEVPLEDAAYEYAEHISENFNDWLNKHDPSIDITVVKA